MVPGGDLKVGDWARIVVKNAKPGTCRIGRIALIREYTTPGASRPHRDIYLKRVGQDDPLDMMGHASGLPEVREPFSVRLISEMWVQPAEPTEEELYEWSLAELSS